MYNNLIFYERKVNSMTYMFRFMEENKISTNMEFACTAVLYA